MGTKMKKGILRPIQFITKIFDSKEEEIEIQIGLPTDVKHLAHIGFHGPETTGPSWMDHYHSAPLNDVPGLDPAPSTNQWASQEINFPCHEIEESPRDAESQSPRPLRPRHSRRHQSEGTIAVDKDSSSVKKKGHRFRKKKEGSKEDNNAAANNNPDVPAVPKSKKKKSKGASEGGSGSLCRPRRKDQAVVAPEAKLVAEEIGAIL
ncbi:uncharacterized protein LOC144543798 isoform X2 [Carex rostrata]